MATLQSLPRAPLNVLIVGAGICGPALAILLQKSNPKNSITIIERSPSLRSTGQQIDLKTQAPHILRKMGLLDEIKSRCVNETGLEIVDAKGKQTAYFGAAASGERRPGLTSEHEIMRGNMVQVLYDASVKQDAELGGKSGNKSKHFMVSALTGDRANYDSGNGQGVTYIFNQTIKSLSQRTEGVTVTFADGSDKDYDLVVAADGQGSRTRQLAFGKEVSDASFKSLGIHSAYFSVSRIKGEGSLAKGHLAPGRRMILTRTSDRPVTGVLLFIINESLNGCYKESLESQKEAFAKAFEDSDWQADRLVTGMKASEDFYAHEHGQIKMEKLSTGRVALLGDAGYCPSPFAGMGTNLCLVGAYVLAGELARQDTIAGALKSYDEKMRPFIHESQKLPPLSMLFPSSLFGIWLTQKLIWIVSKITMILPQSQQEDTHWERLPEYPELNLSS